MLAFDDNETGDGLPESQLMLQATVCSSMWLKVYHAAMCQSGGQQALAVNSCQHACSGSAQRLNPACRPIGGDQHIRASFAWGHKGRGRSVNTLISAGVYDRMWTMEIQVGLRVSGLACLRSTWADTARHCIIGTT